MPALGHLSSGALYAMAEVTHRRAYRRGESLYHEGDPGLGLYVVIGLVPLLSFGRAFGVYDTAGGVSRYHFAYLLPALAAEAFYAWLLMQAVSGG